MATSRRSGRGSAGRSGCRPSTNTTNSAEHQEAADQAELLADDGEDEVGVGLGQEAPLGPGVAEADAAEPTGRDPDLGLEDLAAPVAMWSSGSGTPRGAAAEPLEREEPIAADATPATAIAADLPDRGAGHEEHGQHDRRRSAAWCPGRRRP